MLINLVGACMVCAARRIPRQLGWHACHATLADTTAAWPQLPTPCACVSPQQEVGQVLQMFQSRLTARPDGDTLHPTLHDYTEGQPWYPCCTPAEGGGAGAADVPVAANGATGRRLWQRARTRGAAAAGGDEQQGHARPAAARARRRQGAHWRSCRSQS